MLCLTDDAVRAIHDLTAIPDLPDTAGIRITPQEKVTEIAMFLAAGPERGDEVVVSSQARVYLAPEAAQLLIDQTLDAYRTERGGVDFRFRPQFPSDSRR